MFYTIYASSAKTPYTQQQLVDLLNLARTNNEKLGITGILLYNRGTFIQMLEGDEQAVKTLFNKIDKDPRHHLVFTLLDGEKKERHFPDWSMGFKDLDSPEIREIPGFNNFINEPLDSEAYYLNPLAAVELLNMFKGVVR